MIHKGSINTKEEGISHLLFNQGEGGPIYFATTFEMKKYIYIYHRKLIALIFTLSSGLELNLTGFPIG